jgi:membrane protein
VPVSAWLERARRFLADELWQREDRGAGLLQLLVMIAQGVGRHQILLRAHSLTYITLLSMIPLLALAVSLVQALGVRDALVGFVVAQVAAVAPQAAEFIQTRVAEIKFGSLGTVGAAALFLTTVLAVGNVERSFNHIFGVTRQRPWIRRFPDYLAVVIIAPLVLGVAIPLGTTLRSETVVGWLQGVPLFSALYDSGLAQIPTLLFVLGFSFFYWFLPNTQVRWLSALLGGIVAGLLFALAQLAYVRLNAGAARYDVLFGGLAFLPLFIVWVYVSWVVVMLGAELAFAHQNLSRYRREVRGPEPSPAEREALGLAVALEVAGRFATGGPCWTPDGLADALAAPVRAVREVLDRLEEAGVVAARADGERSDAFQLGRPAENVRVGDVLDALRGGRSRPLARGRVAAVVEATLADLERCQREGSARDTLENLLERCASTSTTTPPRRSAPR